MIFRGREPSIARSPRRSPARPVPSHGSIRLLQTIRCVPLCSTARGSRRSAVKLPPTARYRSALIRFWRRHHLLRVPVPLTGAAALCADAPFTPSAWPPTFLRALAAEAADARQALTDLERAWFTARVGVSRRRRDSHAAAAVDLLAATPLLSATTLAHRLGLSIKTGTRLLDFLVAAGIAVEVTHRSKRRLFGLTGLAPLRDAVRPPYRPDPTRGRGRPRLEQPDDPADSVVLPLPSAPLTPIDRRRFNYSDLDHWMAQTDQAIRHARRTLSALAQPTRMDAGLSNEPLEAHVPARSLDIPPDRDHQPA